VFDSSVVASDFLAGFSAASGIALISSVGILGPFVWADFHTFLMERSCASAAPR
jgi:hypothetical protein